MDYARGGRTVSGERMAGDAWWVIGTVGDREWVMGNGDDDRPVSEPPPDTDHPSPITPTPITDHRSPTPITSVGRP